MTKVQQVFSKGLFYSKKMCGTTHKKAQAVSAPGAAVPSTRICGADATQSPSPICMNQMLRCRPVCCRASSRSFCFSNLLGLTTAMMVCYNKTYAWVCNQTCYLYYASTHLLTRTTRSVRIWYSLHPTACKKKRNCRNEPSSCTCSEKSIKHFITCTELLPMISPLRAHPQYSIYIYDHCHQTDTALVQRTTKRCRRCKEPWLNRIDLTSHLCTTYTSRRNRRRLLQQQ